MLLDRVDGSQRDEFDAALTAPPAGHGLDPWQRQLRDALGVT